jgi:trehalose 6-phosphate phosphatase
MKIPHGAPPALDPERHGVFLDIDGTIVEIAALPEHVSGDAELVDALRMLGQRHGGAVAVLTGRSIRDADRILGHAVPYVAGVHGLERRLGDGIVRTTTPERLPGDLRRRVYAVGSTLEALVEEKAGGFAIHYRARPEFGSMVRRAVEELATRHGLRTIHGKMVAELLAPGPHKGNVLLEIMADRRFVGRLPVAVGDDVTDEDAFAAAVERGGFAVLVGPARPSNATYRLDSVTEVRRWLAEGRKQ